MSEPVLRVVRGDATAEEIAALVAVLTSRGSVDTPADTPRSLWAQPVLRAALHPAPGAWRASSLPR